MKQTPQKWIRNLPIQRKLLYSYLCICAVCLIAFWGIGIPQITRLSEENILYSAEQARSQTHEYLSFRMESMERVALSFAYNDELVDIFSKQLSGDSWPGLRAQLRDKAIIESELLGAQLNHAQTLDSIRLYLNDDFSYVSRSSNYCRPFSMILDTPWYAVMVQKRLASYYIPPAWNETDDIVSMVHLISSPRDFTQAIGAVIIDAPVAKIRSILENCSVTPNSYSYLINDEGAVVAASSNALFVPAPEDIYAGLRASGTAETADNLYFSCRLDECRWTLVQVLPTRDIASSQRSTLLVFVIACAAILAASIVLSVIVSTTITRRIARLSGAMCSLQYLRSMPPSADRTGDEVDYLISSYNSMVTHLNTLTDENIRKGQRINETELALLHTQINPHLLFNTLDMIRTLASDAGEAKVTAATGALSRFYRASLGQDTVWATLSEELEHIRAYMDIQQLRFENRVELLIDIPQALLDVNLPRITLQPIVENALAHGIMGREDWSGQIRISAMEQDGALFLSIRDNGVGIPADKVSALLEPGHAGRGIGLGNTHERLKGHYGPEYGLTIRSAEGEYTEVSVRIRLLRGKEKAHDRIRS